MITLEISLTEIVTPRQIAQPEVTGPRGRVPRVSRLMALAIRFDDYLRDTGTTAAELARYFGVTRAYLTQILNLTNLAPDIQEALLMLPRVERGRDPVKVFDLQPLAVVLDWEEQRRMWAELLMPCPAMTRPNCLNT